MGYQVRFVNPQRAYGLLKDELDAAYHDCMAKGELIDRAHLADFEAELAEFVGVEHAVGVGSGYDALHLALRAAGVGPGCEVVVPAHTFVATCSAVVNAGATPVLADVGPDFNLSPAALAKAVTPRTRAVLPVHLNGYMADMAAIDAMAREHGLVVLEDACQSLGAAMDGRKAGAWGRAGCWSFYPFKILGGYGDGGAITTDDADLALWCRRMRYNGEDRATGEYHGHGFTCLLDNLQAAFLRVKLRHLPAWIARRRQIAARYQAGLAGLPGLSLPHYDDPRRDHVYQNYVVRHKAGEAFSQALRQAGVEVLTQFRKPYYQHAALNIPDTGFPETEALSREVTSLPLYPELTDAEVDHVIGAARAFCEAWA